MFSAQKSKSPRRFWEINSWYFAHVSHEPLSTCKQFFCVVFFFGENLGFRKAQIWKKRPIWWQKKRTKRAYRSITGRQGFAEYVNKNSRYVCRTAWTSVSLNLLNSAWTSLHDYLFCPPSMHRTCSSPLWIEYPVIPRQSSYSCLRHLLYYTRNVNDGGDCWCWCLACL